MICQPACDYLTFLLDWTHPGKELICGLNSLSSPLAAMPPLAPLWSVFSVFLLDLSSSGADWPGVFEAHLVASASSLFAPSSTLHASNQNRIEAELPNPFLRHQGQEATEALLGLLQGQLLKSGKGRLLHYWGKCQWPVELADAGLILTPSSSALSAISVALAQICTACNDPSTTPSDLHAPVSPTSSGWMVAYFARTPKNSQCSCCSCSQPSAQSEIGRTVMSPPIYPQVETPHQLRPAIAADLSTRHVAWAVLL